MTYLHFLIKLRDDLLEKRSTMSDDVEHVADKKAIDIKMVEIENPTAIEYKNDLHDIIKQYKSISEQNQKIIDTTDQLIEKIHNDIKILAKQKFMSDDVNEKFSLIDTPHYWIKSELEKLVKVRAHQYNDWRYPGLQLYPPDKSWIDCMVGCDPLYLVSDDVLKIKELTATYPELYQSRLRFYDYEEIKVLPKNQFGLVLLWHYFERSNMASVEHHLREIFDLLRDGGVLMFSYNNCNLKESMLLAERGLLNYNHQELIEEVLANIGYEIIKFEDVETGNDQYRWLSWAEVKRPGELNTVKAHQVLGKIVPKN